VSIINPAESKINSINVATEYDTEPIPSTNSSNPSVDYQPYLEFVTQLDMSILGTTDNSLPSNAQIGIFGCAERTTIATKAQIESVERSRTTPCKFFSHKTN
jgi:hypothetical protein